MDKLTDAEIINCLNDTVGKEHIGIYCTDKNGNYTTVVKLVDMVDLIKRLQSENAELKSELTITKNNFENAQKLYDESVKIGQRMQEKLIQAHKKLQTAKSEAIKEFGKLVIDKIDSGIISHSSDIVDLVAEEIEKIEGK